MRTVFALERHMLQDPSSSKWFFAHRLILRFALSAIHIFAWIFVFEFYYHLNSSVDSALFQTILLFALSQIVTCLATPYTARYLRFGARKAMFFGTLLCVVAFSTLNAAFEGAWGPVGTALAVTSFALCMGLYRALYWIPYVIESEANTQRPLSITAQVVVALAPFIGGLMITAVVDGAAILFQIGAVMIALSLIPLLFVADVYENFTLGYREAFQRLLDREHYRLVRESFFDGMSGAALLFFWPLAAFLLLGRAYDTLGLILALTLLIAVVMRRVVRKWMNVSRLSRTAFFDAVLTLTPWVLRLGVATPLGMITVDSYFYTTSKRTMGADPFSFEQMADGGTYVDEFTALKEIAISLGRIAMCLFGALTLAFTSTPVMFTCVILAAAVGSTATVLWSRAN